jgi:hypothetical protein
MAEDSKTLETTVAEASLAPEPSVSSDQPAQQYLTPENFRQVLQQIAALGLTWTSDLPPQLVAKEQDGSSFASENLREIQDKYPSFPNELGYVIWYALTGTEPLTDLAGSRTDLRLKAEIVREELITPEFRDEFFFSHMVKVPSFDNVDWEVIVKTSERGVQRFPGNAYALVTILMEGNAHYGDKRENVTFAINEARLEKLLTVLKDMRESLKRAGAYGYQLRQGEEVDTDATL